MGIETALLIAGAVGAVTQGGVALGGAVASENARVKAEEDMKKQGQEQEKLLNDQKAAQAEADRQAEMIKKRDQQRLTRVSGSGLTGKRNTILTSPLSSVESGPSALYPGTKTTLGS